MSDTSELSSKLREIRAAIPARFREPEPDGPKQDQQRAETAELGKSKAQDPGAALDPAEGDDWAETLEMVADAQARFRLAEETIERLEARKRDLKARLTGEITV